MSLVKILDYNLYKKKEKALKRYFMKSYKYLTRYVIPTLNKEHKIDGIYEIELPIDELFNKVYGKLLLKFSVKNDIAVLEDIVPNDILIYCYERDLPTYKGIPYVTSKDLDKLKIMERLL